jgi:dipeptidase D
VEFEKMVKELSLKIKYELKNTEPDLTITLEKTSLPKHVIDPAVTHGMLQGVYACPNGMIRMADDMPGVVETSTNLAILKSDGEKIEVCTLQRSAVDSAKEDLCNMIRCAFEMAGATVEHAGSYPGWKPNMESPILKAMTQVYEKKFGKTPQIKVIHAGLECGIIGGAFPNLDMISFGPTIRNPHSPDEKVKIDTVGLFWEYLTETLKNAPVKS